MDKIRPCVCNIGEGSNYLKRLFRCENYFFNEPMTVLMVLNSMALLETWVCGRMIRVLKFSHAIRMDHVGTGS